MNNPGSVAIINRFFEVLKEIRLRLLKIISYLFQQKPAKVH